MQNYAPTPSYSNHAPTMNFRDVHGLHEFVFATRRCGIVFGTVSCGSLWLWTCGDGLKCVSMLLQCVDQAIG